MIGFLLSVLMENQAKLPMHQLSPQNKEGERDLREIGARVMTVGSAYVGQMAHLCVCKCGICESMTHLIISLG